MSVQLPPFRSVAVFLCALVVLAAPGAAILGPNDAPAHPNLAAQVKALADRNGFSLVGLHRLEDVPPRPVDGPPERQIQQLLDGYNYVMVNEVHEKRLIVLGKKRWVPPKPPPPKDTVLATRRMGAHHIVEATLVGGNRAEMRVRLMIDTGASFIVLPLSMSDDLGLARGALADTQVQTAKGTVGAKVGRLRALRLGNEEIANVKVAFIEDALLGGNRLLGMNVLGRFRMTLDDQRNQLILAPRK